MQGKPYTKEKKDSSGAGKKIKMIIFILLLIAVNAYTIYSVKEFKKIHEVIVENGSGSGKYREGDRVVITANVPENETTEFTEWSVDKENLNISDRSAKKIEFIMPEENVHLTANYVSTYLLAVKNGSGNGRYKVGETVTVTADNDILNGAKFANWTIEEGSVDISDITANEITFTMPEETVSLSANYELMLQRKNIEGGKVSGAAFKEKKQSGGYLVDIDITKLATIKYEAYPSDFFISDIIGVPYPIKFVKWDDTFDEDKNLYGMMDSDGNILTEFLYSELEEKNGWIVAQKEGSFEYGVLSMNGKVAIPFECENVFVLSEHWIVTHTKGDSDSFSGYDTVYYIEGNKCIYTVLTNENKTLYTYDCIGEYLYITNGTSKKTIVCDSQFNLVAIEKLENKEALWSLNGDSYSRWRELKAAGYQVIDSYAENYSTDILLVRKEEQEIYGLVGKSNDWIAPLEYEGIKKDEENDAVGYYWVVKDGLLGCIRRDGTITLEPDTYPIEKDFYTYWEKGYVDNITALAVSYYEEDGTHTLIAADGQKTPGLPEDLFCIDSVGYLWWCFAEDEEEGYWVDWHGNFVLKDSDEYIDEVSQNNNYLYTYSLEGDSIYSIDGIYS